MGFTLSDKSLPPYRCVCECVLFAGGLGYLLCACMDISFWCVFFFFFAFFLFISAVSALSISIISVLLL